MNAPKPQGTVFKTLTDVAPMLERHLTRGDLAAPGFPTSEIRCLTVRVAMRDGVRLATDLYLPPVESGPVVAMRTPYGRATDVNVGMFMSFARRGYVAVVQDCRGTGDSEPDSWDYYMYESEDGYDFVGWISQQTWYEGFIGSCGASYVGQTQWPMAMHPAMSTIVPQVSGLGVAFNTARLYMFHNAYARVVGKGDKVAVSTYDMERLFAKETMEGGFFNEPIHEAFSDALVSRYPDLQALPSLKAKRWLWELYCGLGARERAMFIKHALGVKQVTSVDIESLPALLGQQISHDALSLPAANPSALCKSFHAPPLLLTGWYDWALNDALATWDLVRRGAKPEVNSRARIIITPTAHHAPGYHEGVDTHPELMRIPTTANQVGLLLNWYQAVRDDDLSSWPTVIYYLMGANEWRTAADWPLSEAKEVAFYLDSGGALTTEQPRGRSSADHYTYDPYDPTPTVGGSILSYLYPPGSVDVSAVQKRSDVLVFTTSALESDLDVVGPLRMILFASSSALDTDFVVRLSDVFPDGRAIQIQSGILRARYRDLDRPKLLEPGKVECFEIDLWATANRFKAGHLLRVDISSADFPHFDRNSNRGGGPGSPVPARQTVYHDSEHPSHLLVRVLGN